MVSEAKRRERGGNERGGEGEREVDGGRERPTKSVKPRVRKVASAPLGTRVVATGNTCG